ncbi:hypothetical protein AVEN_142094-1 [Araneus ventricosus]|uniref:Uncharacterized protein n=1 Tax=Araneus ventricosus TaxID=182803 RepID=A0A4Y2HZX9_ARAVE|nr:hypothetical protein AVEN_142094-1 [Araneus ventricosus]
MELLELNSMSSSSYTDTDVITLEYQSQNRLDFPTLARECDLYGISDRAAASIASAVLQDIGIVHEGETLHVDRLPLCHLLNSLDGATTGPTEFCGPIGKAIKTCEELPVAPFSSISVENIPDNIDRMVLSNDQQYLYDICLAISRVECYFDLALKKPGSVAHSRWLTTAGRILRLNVATEKPSDNLIILATFIMKVYAPVWFHVKTKPAITEGARHIWRLISFSRYLESNLRNIVDTVIQRNCFFCHPENLLLSMLTDKRENVKSLEPRKLFCARNVNRGSSQVRIFQVPKLDFNEKDYFALINWQRVGRFEPPLLMNVPFKEIVAMVKVRKTEEWSKYPCHAQAVERCIRLVSESVYGEEKRHGFILNRIQSRSLIKYYNTKKDYNL